MDPAQPSAINQRTIQISSALWSFTFLNLKSHQFISRNRRRQNKRKVFLKKKHGMKGELEIVFFGRVGKIQLV